MYASALGPVRESRSFSPGLTRTELYSIHFGRLLRRIHTWTPIEWPFIKFKACTCNFCCKWTPYQRSSVPIMGLLVRDVHHIAFSVRLWIMRGAVQSGFRMMFELSVFFNLNFIPNHENGCLSNWCYRYFDTVANINALEPAMRALTDSELKAKTGTFLPRCPLTG